MEGKDRTPVGNKTRTKTKPLDIRFQRQLDENESVLRERIKTGDLIWFSLPNVNDNLAIRQLYQHPLGELRLDLYAPDARKSLAQFRLALIKVYVIAGQARYLSKPTSKQIKAARTALTQFTRGIEKLDQVNPVSQTGLHLAVAGSSVDDVLGESQVNDFASICRNIRMEVAPQALALKNAISAETAKQTKSGERPKRLRTLVEVFCPTGGSQPGDCRRRLSMPIGAMMMRLRSSMAAAGKFLQLAVALFCEIDVFAHTEVEGAVTDVHEARRKRAQSGSDVEDWLRARPVLGFSTVLSTHP